MMMPPSLVGTIVERTASAFSESGISRCRNGSFAPSFAARMRAPSRTPMIESTAQLMWFSMAEILVTRSNCALRSSSPYLARGSSTTSSFDVYVFSALVILMV